MPTDNSLNGQTAIVTGAARGLGQKIAEKLATAGANVACVDVEEAALKTTVSALTSSDLKAEAFTCDVTNSDRVNEIVNAVVKKWGAVHILVNNAGITRDGMMMRMSDEQWDSVININLKGTFLFSRAVTKPMMKARYGRIINMASISGLLMGNPGQANYSASKAGIVGFTRTVAKELASRNITVNAIAPGFIATEMTAKLGEAILEGAKKQIPLGRLGKPEEVADAVFYLSSKSASFVTGIVLTVDGGLSL